MSFLQDTILPGSAGLHGGGAGTINGQQKGLGKSQSHAGLLSPLLRIAREPSKALEGFIEGWSAGNIVPPFPEDEDSRTKAQVLYVRMRNATSYDDWRAAASELDLLEGNDVWKQESESAEYNYELVESRLRQLDEARINCDVKRMLFLMRTSLTRGLGGMGDLRLYKHSHIGTKSLIERYISSATETMQALLDVSAKQKDDGMDTRYVLEQMLAARQSFGRSALLLSGGGTFGMNHIGVVKSLWKQKLLPRIISGASAGSIVCAVLCTKTDQEIPTVLDEFCYGDLAVFEKEGEEEGVLTKVARFLKYGAIFDISHLVRVMRNLLGDITFQEAYNRTRRILNITVSSASLYELPRLLNYVTAPNVMIWSAVAASCSVPFVFSAASLLAKDPRTGREVPWDPSPQRWIDGSVDNDLPMTRLAEMFNVNHFIVSQVNPHVVPFLMKEEDSIAKEAQQSMSAFAAGPGWLHGMANLAKGEALHRMHVFAELGIFPNYFTKARSILSQRYSGDITIFPEISYAHFPRVLSNPTTDFMVQASLAGERATWPKLSRVQNHCAIELALDDAVQQLRARVVFSPSQVDLRLNAFTRPLSQGDELKREPRRSSRPLYKTTRSIGRGESVSQLTRSSAPITFDIPTVFTTSPPVEGTPRRKGPHHRKFPSHDSTIKISCDDVLSTTTSDGENDVDDALVSSDINTDYLSSSPGSPPSAVPELWPTTHQLFPSASQPATPSTASRSFNKTPGPTPPGMLGLTMTSSRPNDMAAAPSSPELRYKKLFHSKLPIRSVPSGSPRNENLEHHQASPRTHRKMSTMGSEKRKKFKGLMLDISGTRGMMMRRKRSSTNLAQGNIG